MEDKKTVRDKYIPTVAEERLLTILLNPEYIDKNVSEKCLAANVSRQIYYDAMKKPGFEELVRGYRESILQGEISDLIQIGISEAKKGSYQHWKTLLEMAGAYAPKTKTEVTTPDGLAATLSVVFADSTE